MRQPTLFERKSKTGAHAAEQIVIYALGEFQARGKVLAARELPLDRLRGALRRAAETFGGEELSDEQAVEALRSLGADIRQVPTFVAKHPYRVRVEPELAERASAAYRAAIESAPEKP